jgi:hypothetical protein
MTSEADICRAAHKMIELYDRDAGCRAGWRVDQPFNDQCWRWNSIRNCFSQVPKPRLNFAVGGNKMPKHVRCPSKMEYVSTYSEYGAIFNQS